MSIPSSSSLASTLDPSQLVKSALNDTVASANLSLEKIYDIDSSSWYTAKPYGFKANRRDGSSWVMFLPISPSNINISTNFATNVIPTIYGTVEEHSDVRYYDIVIEGTTGMAPKFVTPVSSSDPSAVYSSSKKKGRASFPITSSGALGGFFSSTIAQVTNILSQAGKALDTSTANQVETGVYTDQTGYLAFHNLYRFLLKYKKDAAGVESNIPRTKHPLTFFNYKDGNQYDVAIKNFTLRKSVENPMLYYYSITMRGYNIRKCGGLEALDSLTQRLSDLGLNGVKGSTLLSDIKSVSGNAKAIVGSVANGINLFGR